MPRNGQRRDDGKGEQRGGKTGANGREH